MTVYECTSQYNYSSLKTQFNCVCVFVFVCVYILVATAPTQLTPPSLTVHTLIVMFLDANMHPLCLCGLLGPGEKRYIFFVNSTPDSVSVFIASKVH